ncbi:right-handed parallel beta-helix repeat-containing protein [Microbacterium betulae]|uniref:Right-handed parallel beta-helix repeat-containing protein n=1 Tax=Microbacterium betulae TaxID=2981139 RepID=A0AA97FI55_9MICO|nr:right-handed parallel beta-helix repeat-containing protein [Microbacterium sp. AB]WOF23696.1 right-handed parallel beta-helix repeat-containing protein [Microbacterium sp. AB]
MTIQDVHFDGGEFVIIVGRGQLGSGTTKGADGLSVINCTAVNCAVFVDAWYSNHVTILGNNVTMYRAGFIGHGGESNPGSSSFIDARTSILANTRGIVANNMFRSSLLPAGFGTPDAEGKKSTGVFLTSCRDYIVEANFVTSVRDVGIDMEGCFRCAVVGNTVVDAHYGCITTFYRSIQCSIVANTIVQTSSNTVNAYSTGIRGGIVMTPSVTSPTTTYLENVQIKDNLIVNDPGNSAMGIVEAALTTGQSRTNKMTVVSGNTIHQGKIEWRGSDDCSVVNNSIYNGAIEVYSCDRARVMGNQVRRKADYDSGILLMPQTSFSNGTAQRCVIAGNYVWLPSDAAGATISVGGATTTYRTYAVVAHNYISTAPYVRGGDTTNVITGNVLLP